MDFPKTVNETYSKQLLVKKIIVTIVMHTTLYGFYGFIYLLHYSVQRTANLDEIIEVLAPH